MRWSSKSVLLTAQALGVRQDDFMQLKVQGVLDAAEVLIVALPPGREAHMLWPPHHAGDGHGLRPPAPSRTCGWPRVPKGWAWAGCPFTTPRRWRSAADARQGSYPLAVLCLGPVEAYYAEPMLQQEKWANRAPLEDADGRALGPACGPLTTAEAAPRPM